MKFELRIFAILIALGCGSCEKPEQEEENVPKSKVEVIDSTVAESETPPVTLTHDAVFRKVLDFMEKMIGALEQSGDVNEAVGRLARLDPEGRAIADLGRKIGEADAEEAERFHGQLQAAMGPITERSRKAVAKLLGHDPFAPDAADITLADQKRLMADVSRIDAAVGQLVGYFEEAFPMEEEHHHEGEADEGD